MKKLPPKIPTCCLRSRLGYCIELATLEKALFELDPIRRIVPTTRTRITASITAYSAISCPASSDQILRMNSDIISLQSTSSLCEGSLAIEEHIMPQHEALVKCHFARFPQAFPTPRSVLAALKRVP